MTIEPGRELLHYRVVEKIGEGGMGLVLKATDTTLGRDVAIKVLPEGFAADPDRLARFEREAKLLASLNHPNIATIHGLHEAEGVRFLAMELVAGENLASRLDRGALPVGDALTVCSQVARALEVAHDSGVIHRDLKPANIQLTPEGQIKVLDFGLAKALDPGAATEGLRLTHSPTLTSNGTRAGMILGTAAYMSPEQARGKPLDKRTDNWSFGCVLFECLTGRTTFGGETVTDTLARILEREPDWSRLPERTPNRIRRLLERCLAKETSRRLRDIGDARLELEEVIAEVSGPPTAASTDEKVAAKPWTVRTVTLLAAAFALGGIVGGAALRPLLTAPALRSADALSRVALQIPEGLQLGGWTLAPDGVSLIFSAVAQGEGSIEERRQIYRRPLDSYEAQPIEGTLGAIGFAVSPGSKWIAFMVGQGTGLQLRKVALDGGPPVTIWDGSWENFTAFDWIDDRALLFASFQGALSRLSADGGDPQIVSAGDESGAMGGITSLDVLPGGTGALYNAYTEGGEGYFSQISYVSLVTGERRRIVEDGASPKYLAGHLLFSRRDALLAAPFDPRRGSVTGGVRSMLSGMRMGAVWLDAGFSVSPTGDLLYEPGGNVSADRRLVYVDAAGHVEPLSELRRPFDGGTGLSPDGERIAVFMSGENRSWQIWVHDVARDSLRRIAVPDRDCSNPLWFPDGRRLLFRASKTGEPQAFYQVDAAGNGAPELLFDSKSKDVTMHATSFSPDGSVLALDTREGGKNRSQLLALDGTRELRPLIDRGDSSTSGAVFSPDGRWVAYTSTETERNEVYVAPYPVRGSGWLVSRDGGGGALWSQDGHELYYGLYATLYAVKPEFSPSFSASPPVRLLDIDPLQLHELLGVAPGRRFLAIEKGPRERDVTSLNLVLGWAKELE